MSLPLPPRSFSEWSSRPDAKPASRYLPPGRHLSQVRSISCLLSESQPKGHKVGTKGISVEMAYLCQKMKRISWYHPFWFASSLRTRVFSPSQICYQKHTLLAPTGSPRICLLGEEVADPGPQIPGEHSRCFCTEHSIPGHLLFQPSLVDGLVYTEGSHLIRHLHFSVPGFWLLKPSAGTQCGLEARRGSTGPPQ